MTENGSGTTEPTASEIDAARRWLAKAGTPVGVPTRLLAIRIGARRGAGYQGAGRKAGILALSLVCGVAYQFLQELPGVRGVEMTAVAVVYFLAIGVQAGAWFVPRRRERGLPRMERSSGPMLLGGWYLASALVTFGGGFVLCVAMYLLTPARTYAWSWFGLLVVSGVWSAVILARVLRAPAVAEDEGSLAVDKLLRIEDAYVVMPAQFAVLVLVDLLLGNRQPPEFTGWLIAYAALAVATQTIGGLRYLHRRTLPPGHYGTSVVTRQESAPEMNWAPPRA